MKRGRILTHAGEILHVAAVGDRWVEVLDLGDDHWRLTDRELLPQHWLPPVVPTVIFAIGLNYRTHAEEMNKPIPQHPVVTMKNPAAAIGHGHPVVLPRFLASDAVDFEVELAVVIGKPCRNVRPGQALDYVAGYTVANDISARDWQQIYAGGQWCRGKSFDTFCPLGPVLVTPDELPDPGVLTLGLDLNGTPMQTACTDDLIFSVPELIAFLAGSTTLLPGTVILTGTPTGVGTARTPPRYLQPGDQLRTWVAGIGELINPVIAEELP